MCGADHKALARLLEQPVEDVPPPLPAPPYLGTGPVCGADHKALARLLQKPVQDVALALPRPAAHCDHTQRRMHLHGEGGDRGPDRVWEWEAWLAHVPLMYPESAGTRTCPHARMGSEGRRGQEVRKGEWKGKGIAQLVQGGLPKGSWKSRDTICRPLPTMKGQCASCGHIYARLTFFNTSTAAWPTWNFPSSTE